jgi:protein TonB
VKEGYMLAYAANRPLVVDRRPYPNAMLAIIALHVAVAAGVMSAKMQIDRHPPQRPTVVDLVPLPKPPAPDPHVRKPTDPQPAPTSYRPNPADPQPRPENPTFGPGPAADPGPVNPLPLPIPEPKPLPTQQLSSSGAQLLTPLSELKPPYPPSKLLNEEEAVLRLKLTIGANGRVVAVEPVGRTDPAFLDAARRHLIAHWRYKPAIEDGQPVASSAVITLRFELDG